METSPLSKQERRELKHQMKLAKRALSGRRDRIISLVWWVVFIAILGGLIGYIIWNMVRPLSGTKISLLDRTHVPAGEKPNYNSNPPTSGPHYADTEEWGIYDRPLVMERLVHNLEHGGVLVFYNCENCEELVGRLGSIVEQLRKKDRKVILAPSKEIDSKIALSSWGWLDKMEEVDEERIWKFFDDHINKAPEREF